MTSARWQFVEAARRFAEAIEAGDLQLAEDWAEAAFLLAERDRRPVPDGPEAEA